MTFLARAVDQPDKRRREIHGEFVRFFNADLSGRGAVTNAKTDVDWRKIYSQRERARFPQELRGDLGQGRRHSPPPWGDAERTG